jgi:proline iminopeptidase
MSPIRTLRRIVTIGIVATLAVVTLAVPVRWYLQRRIADADAIRTSAGIDSLVTVRIGGIDQWLHVRGEDRNNPILLFIHGGPGQAFIPFAREFQRPWERHFTVVQWDQRGAGKTYASNDRELQRRTLTVARMQADALEVVNYLKRRFMRDKIVVMGASWGGVLGLWLAHEHPDAVAAYVGVGQAIDMQANAKTAFDDALKEARARQNLEAINDLESLQPYPSAATDVRAGGVAQQWQAELLGPPPDRRYLRMTRVLSTLVTAPEYSLRDVYGFARGQRLSLETLLPEVRMLNMSSIGTDFTVPIFFFQGRADPYCRPAILERYASTITAPRHEIVWFEQAGHFPFFEERQRFLEELLTRILPLVGRAQRNFAATSRVSASGPQPGARIVDDHPSQYAEGGSMTHLR